MKRSPVRGRVIAAFRHAGGVLRTTKALGAGVHPRDLYALRDSGVVTRVSRGVYRLADLPPLAEPDLVTVAYRIPKAVIAIVSALHFHGLTTEIPHEVSIALPRGTARPRLEWPPLRIYRFSGSMFTSGIETHERDGVEIRVYEPAKTVADCFKFRNRLGIEVAIEALRTGLAERKFAAAQVLRAAKLCRVDRIVRPYLEAVL
ncbi:MAG: type IV toxin-antitoxin system AbiEi family antitoxin domain-containing protein [Acidobacteriia bacterium]|nr:type IV toxin-antitoxin system AbiEi family antitoxin domain-containing protein [Terriglobia bacterium]